MRCYGIHSFWRCVHFIRVDNICHFVLYSFLVTYLSRPLFQTSYCSRLYMRMVVWKNWVVYSTDTDVHVLIDFLYTVFPRVMNNALIVIHAQIVTRVPGWWKNSYQCSSSNLWFTVSSDVLHESLPSYLMCKTILNLRGNILRRTIVSWPTYVDRVITASIDSLR